MVTSFPILSYLVQNKAQEHFPIKLLKKKKKRKTKSSLVVSDRADADKPKTLKMSHRRGTSWGDQKTRIGPGAVLSQPQTRRLHPEVRWVGCQEW